MVQECYDFKQNSMHDYVKFKGIFLGKIQTLKKPLLSNCQLYLFFGTIFFSGSQAKTLGARKRKENVLIPVVPGLFLDFDLKLVLYLSFLIIFYLIRYDLNFINSNYLILIVIHLISYNFHQLLKIN